MQVIATEGAKYGLYLNNSKLEMMQIHCNAPIYDGEGKAIKIKESIKYLGAILHRTGRVDSEISSKLGMAKQEFRALSQIWSHANITKRRKLELYRSLVISKLLYGLQTVWLSKGLRQRIDAFHCSCIRRILGIAHSYISRVTNADVLRQGNAMPLSKILLQ